MKLVAFTVEKYRSIGKAHRISTDGGTILIGPNNEGKSNILRALVAAMNVLTRGSEFITTRQREIARFSHRRFYDWDLDYPVHLRLREPDGCSKVVLEFELTEVEVQEFRAQIKSNLNGTLPLRIEMGRDSASVRVVKQGRGSANLTAKSDRIAKFVAERLVFEHIPAVRTAESAQQIVEMMVERELGELARNPDYIAAVTKIAELEQPLLTNLAGSIKQTLQNLLPAVRDVRLQISTEKRFTALRRACEIVIDDGAPTLLQYKGDGVQSLAALGIMRYASDRRGSEKNLVIAIEEPESHLHPKAIHELKAVLDELSTRHQVVLATHCPLFVDRGHVSRNVVVHRNRARPAASVEEVRSVLGVRASDNLRHAEIVLVVEGEDDRVSLTALLRENSPCLREACDNGTLAVDTLSGGTNLFYKLGLLRNALCSYHCFLDNDDCGRTAFGRARDEGLITDADCNFANCPGMRESELEDLLDAEVYRAPIESTYRVKIESPTFQKGKGKWSDRLRDLFLENGKAWDKRVERDVKELVASAVRASPGAALNRHKRMAFDGLVRTLEDRLRGPRSAGM